MRLINDWKASWRLWSVRLSALGATLVAFLLAFPDEALAVWNAMPADIQALLPEQTGRLLSLILFVSTIVARIVRQRRASNGQ